MARTPRREGMGTDYTTARAVYAGVSTVYDGAGIV
jgi:hypothetical protein